MKVARWNVFETTLEAAKDHDNPFWDVTARVRFTAPSGHARTVDAFWDGGRTWRARFSPDEVGPWTWQAACDQDAALAAAAGAFDCVPYDGDNPVFAHGPIRLAPGGRSFAHDDGAPFFYLADTAWNGVLRADDEDWARYLRTRRQQAFTAVQFVCTHWRGHTKDARGETAFAGTERVRLNPAFFRRMDANVAAINAHGLVAVPVVLWTLTKSDPGQVLSEADAVRVARYIVARWGAHNVIWLLGGDGDYRGERADRWKRVGRAVFCADAGNPRDRLVSMHPCGTTTFAPELRDEPWLDFLSYQTGHGDSADHLRWHTSGLPTTDWRRGRALPVVNLEPNYEGHVSYHSKQPHPPQHVRRAAWWSLLLAPPAGITYGCNPIWVWPPRQPEDAEGHPRISQHGKVPPWHEGLELPGVKCMTILARFLAAADWPLLRPAPDLLAAQPGERDVERFVAAARRQAGDLAVIYTPVGGEIDVNTARLPADAAAIWFNPQTAQWRDAPAVQRPRQRFATPDDNDWLLCLGKQETLASLRR